MSSSERYESPLVERGPVQGRGHRPASGGVSRLIELHPTSAVPPSHRGETGPLAVVEGSLIRDSLSFGCLNATRIRSFPGRTDRRPLSPLTAIGTTKLILVKAGQLTLWSPGGGPRRLAAATATVIAGDGEITLTTSDQFDGYIVAVDTASLTAMGVSVPSGGVHRADQSALAVAIISLLQPLITHPPRSRSIEALAVQRALMDLTAGLLSAIDDTQQSSAKPHDSVLFAASSFIAANNGNSALSSAMIARASGVSNRQLQRILAEAGTTVASELMRSRLERAVAVLSDRTRAMVPLQRLAEQVGFGSISRLRRAFATEYGVTPSQYRVAAQSGAAPSARRRSEPEFVAQ